MSTVFEAPKEAVLRDRLHNPPAYPHWSTLIEWRPGRWDAMESAPVAGYPIMHIRGRTADGRLLEPMHYACGGGEEQPPFDGWFVPYDPVTKAGGFYGVNPVEWQPLDAEPAASQPPGAATPKGGE